MPLDENKVTAIATAVYNRLATQWGVAKVPDHHHNGTDSTKINSAVLEGIPVLYGAGAPTAIATKGTLYVNTTGAFGSRLYINTNGATSWTAITTAA